MTKTGFDNDFFIYLSCIQEDRTRNLRGVFCQLWAIQKKNYNSAISTVRTTDIKKILFRLKRERILCYYCQGVFIISIVYNLVLRAGYKLKESHMYIGKGLISCWQVPYRSILKGPLNSGRFQVEWYRCRIIQTKGGGIRLESDLISVGVSAC